MPGVGAGIGFAKACVEEVGVGAEDVVGAGDWVEELVGVAVGVVDGVGVTDTTGLLPEDLEAELDVCFALF